MPKLLRNYLFNAFSWVGGFIIINTVRATFENIFGVSLDELRWGIWVFGFIVIGYFLWRGYTGFIRDEDFYDDDFRW